MAQDSSQVILDQYRQNLKSYGLLGGKLERLIIELLDAKQIEVHSVTHRIKEESHLTRKLSQSTSGYDSLSDVTDICGLRIITYFAEEVDAVAEIIKQEFEIDQENSIDKRQTLDPDQFGYLSVHYIVSIAANRSVLPEYAGLKGLKAEIQMRSILQHAWAEIEHDLGYKSQRAVPRDVVRQFSRLAGLLEIADDGFSALRRSIRVYEAEVDKKIEGDPTELRIDAVSINALIESDLVLRNADALVASISGMIEVPSNPVVVGRIVGAVTFLGFKSVGELKEAIAQNASWLNAFVEDFWKNTTRLNRTGAPKGIGLYYFSILRAVDHGGASLLRAAFGFSDDALNDFVNNVLASYDRTKHFSQLMK